VLLILLDLAATDGVSPAEQQRILEGELGRYMPELLDGPVVVGSKSDIAEVDGGTDATDGDEGVDYVISAVTGTGLGPLLGHLATLVSEARASEATGLGEIVVHRPAPEGVGVERTPSGPGG